MDLVAAETAVTIANAPRMALTYNGLLPGPLLEAEPGDAVRIRLHNRLNRPTNLHYHGLHISPSGNADNVFLSVARGPARPTTSACPPTTLPAPSITTLTATEAWLIRCSVAWVVC